MCLRGRVDKVQWQQYVVAQDCLKAASRFEDKSL